MLLKESCLYFYVPSVFKMIFNRLACLNIKTLKHSNPLFLSLTFRDRLKCCLISLMGFYYSDIVEKCCVIYIVSFLVLQWLLTPTSTQVKLKFSARLHFLQRQSMPELPVQVHGCQYNHLSDNRFVFYACCPTSAVHTVNNNTSY